MWSLFQRNARQAKPARRIPLSIRPRLEALEDRCLLSAPGTLDTSFGSGGIASTTFSGTTYADYPTPLIESNGQIVTAGLLGTSRGAEIGLARFNSNGTLDKTFGQKGQVASLRGIVDSEYYTAAALEGDGKIIVAATAKAGSQGNAQQEFLLARYNTNGTLDTTFHGGSVITSFNAPAGAGAHAIAVYPSTDPVNANKIVAAGEFDSTGIASEFALVRYNPDGTPDTTFGTNGRVLTQIGTEDNIWGVALQPDGKIVAAGFSENRTAGTPFAIALTRYNTDGSLDTSFGNGGVVLTQVGGSSWAYGVVIEPDGAIAVDGYGTLNGVKHYALAQYTSSGALDSTFGTGGIVTTVINPSNNEVAQSLALQSNGKLVAVGNAGLVRYNTDGSLDTTFNGTGVVPRGWDSMAIQPWDGKIVTAAGNGSSFTVGRYWGDAPVPVIGSFTANPNPVTSGSNVTLTASNITDGNPNSTITQVTFYYYDSNGNKVILGYGTEDSSGDWSLTFAVNLASGTYTFFAQAQDNYGALSEPDALTLTVQ